MIRFLFSSLMALGLSVPAFAQDDVAPLAEVGLQPRIEALSVQGGAHGFELGMLLALRAVERSLQTRYDHGLGDRMSNLPLLRLDGGARNPWPEYAPPETLTNLMKTLLTDLAEARAVLEAARDSGEVTPFEMTLQDLWFDVNGNVSRDDGEDAMSALAPILLGRRTMAAIAGAQRKETTVRFDEADHAWLTAYTHMLSGVAHIFVAFDPTRVIASVAEGHARIAEAPSVADTFDRAALEGELARIVAELEQVNTEQRETRLERHRLEARLRELRATDPRDEAAIAAVSAELSGFGSRNLTPLNRRERFLRTEADVVRRKLGQSTAPDNRRWFDPERMRPELDAAYTLIAALRQQPDPDGIRAARDHWRSMMAENRRFWENVAQEDDDDREWIPNTRQTGVFGITVDETTADAWQSIPRTPRRFWTDVCSSLIRWCRPTSG